MAFYKRITLYIPIFLISIGAFLYITVKTASAQTPAGPITGTFISLDWSLGPVDPATGQLNEASKNEMRALLADMKKAGIDTLIPLALGFLNKNCANGSFSEHTYWESSYAPEAASYIAFYEITHELGFKINPGLVAIQTGATGCINPYSGNPTDPNSDPGHIIDYAIRLIGKLKYFVESRGWDWNSFVYGFYIGDEVPIEKYADNTVINYFSVYSSKIKQAYPDKKLVVSPYKYNYSYDQALGWFNNFFNSTSVDIIAPQDSMGTGLTTSYTTNTNHFRALRDAVSAHPGRIAWANVETFMPIPGYIDLFQPSSIDRISQQIASSKPYVSKQITWIFQHTLTQIPEFHYKTTWQGNPFEYTYKNAVLRQKLRNAYTDLYQPTAPFSVRTSFVWNTNYVTKGNLGTIGQNAKITVIYIDTTGNFHKITQSASVLSEDMQTVYIPLTSLPNLSDPNSAYVEPTPTPTFSPSPTNTPTPTGKSGDANGDGKVDDLDYTIWANNYGITNATGPRQGDFNNDKKVDDLDYTIWANNYGK